VCLPTLISVLCLTVGTGLSICNPLRGSWISGVGTALCALALIATLVQLIEAIPFHQQPGQTVLLVAPALFLIVMISHLAAAVFKHKAVENPKAKVA
jgi:hypothetical protein